jgi:hypothetical protein
MASATKREHPLQVERMRDLEPCPACSAELDGAATPLGSIVICARCCTALLWDGTFSRLSARQIEQLPERDRMLLRSIVAAQRARVAARTLH